MRSPDETRPGRLALLALLAGGLVGGLTGCAEPERVVDTSFTQAELESEVVARYPAENPDKPVEARCAGGLEGVVGTVQTCRVTVGSDPADVRVTVADVDDTEAELETTPYVPPIRVAGKVRDALIDDGYRVETVSCTGDLLGVVGQTVPCTVVPANDEGVVTARVAEVEGLTVAITYEIGGEE